MSKHGGVRAAEPRSLDIEAMANAGGGNMESWYSPGTALGTGCPHYCCQMILSCGVMVVFVAENSVIPREGNSSEVPSCTMQPSLLTVAACCKAQRGAVFGLLPATKLVAALRLNDGTCWLCHGYWGVYSHDQSNDQPNWGVVQGSIIQVDVDTCSSGVICSLEGFGVVRELAHGAPCGTLLVHLQCVKILPTAATAHFISHHLGVCAGRAPPPILHKD